MSYADKIRADGVLRDIHDTPARGMIAPTEVASTASTPHAVGDCFIYNDLLYLTTNDIAIGDIITPNMNCTAITVGGEVSNLRSAITHYPQSIDKAIGVRPLVFMPGAYPTPAVGEIADISAPVTPSRPFVCAKAAVATGQKITFKTAGGSSSYRILAVYDASFRVLYRSATTAGEFTHEIDEAGAAWVAINSEATIDDYYAYVGDAISTQIEALTAGKQDKLTFDTTPTSGSANPVTSGGVYSALNPIQQDVAALKNTMDTMSGAQEITDVSVGYGYRTSGESINVSAPEANSSLACAYAACQPGDQFTYYGRGSSNFHNFAFLASDGTIIDPGRVGSNVELLTLTAPAGAAFVVFNALKSLNYYFYKGVLGEKQNKLTFDPSPAEGSMNPVTSGGVYLADQRLEDAIGHHDGAALEKATTAGYYWNSQGDTAVLTEISSWDADTVLVSPGMSVHVHMRGETSSKQNPVLAVNDDNLILARYGQRAQTVQDIYLTVPAGATKLLLTHYTSTTAITAVYPVQLNQLGNIMAGSYDFQGKNVAIIGDSISTNGNYNANTNPLGNVPEIVIQPEDVGVQLSAYLTYWDVAAGLSIAGTTYTSAQIGQEITFTPTAEDVGKIVGKPDNFNGSSIIPWWRIVQNTLGFTPIPVAWSGASITQHEANPEDADYYKEGGKWAASYAWHPSQVRKCGIRVPGTMQRTAPDVIIVYRGTNDASHTRYAKISENYWNARLGTYPTTDVITWPDTDWAYGIIEGLICTINGLRQAYPSARIVLCTLNWFRRIYETGPSRNNYFSLYQYNAAIRETANAMGCGLIDFARDGLNEFNASSDYYQENTNMYTHPNNAGHVILANRALVDLKEENAMK